MNAKSNSGCPRRNRGARQRATVGFLPSVIALAQLVAALGARAEDSASAALYVRTDTDHTRVISPSLRLRAGLPDEDTHLNLAYTVDVWTSASVDIVASASQPVTEQRDELNAGLDRVFGDLTVGAGYRYSTEPDYESHGGLLRFALDLADRATTLAWTAAFSGDRVGRAGDDRFEEQVSTLSTGLSWTQVIDSSALLQLLYDVSAIRGYQASAYRYVAFGSAGPCLGFAPLCRPEQNPRERLRHALAVRLRRALGERWSIGGGYRLYVDDWGLLSHTARGDLAWAPEPQATLALGYRFYTQGAADHYQSVYEVGDVARPTFTRDKELSPLSSHRASLEFDWVWEISSGGIGLSTALALAATFYDYRDFAMLRQTSAFEATAMVGMELP